ncbi:hypothetical protein [Marivirga arenosa]|uniref:Uncharacterized protein n=1 Tax=Marivirga arenosa TaxID=3059076 RepID=A0AA51X4R9_9BACT|nr:hypothetical protein [Marivirga sp. BKB1-2]WNB16788.1 hypothetical protein QYS47_31780 [Marivirga sp. BKB1-2]
MKYLFILFITGFNLSCYSQNQKDILTEFDYFPDQRIEVSNQEYRKGTTILKNTYEQIKNDSGKMVYADHLNLATAFIKLKEPKEIVLNQWYLAQQEDLESTAEIFPMIYSSSESVAGYLSESEYDSLLKKFAKVLSNKEDVKIDPTEYASDNNFNIELVKLMAYLEEKDQEFRMSDMDKQQLIDAENIKIIDSLYKVHGKYIGNSFVGDQYQHSMWAVIQHSDLEHQEKYLPVVQKGVSNGELPATPLKMLIDRVYKKKHGYQIFGSQSGGELADDATIEKVKQEYGL